MYSCIYVKGLILYQYYFSERKGPHPIGKTDMGGRVPFTISKPVLELGKDMDLYSVCMCTYNVYYLQQLMLMIFHQRYPQLQCLTL